MARTLFKKRSRRQQKLQARTLQNPRGLLDGRRQNLKLRPAVP
jgi:hypothetical protein